METQISRGVQRESGKIHGIVLGFILSWKICTFPALLTQLFYLGGALQFAG